jgi:hypothetical protein
MLEESLEKNARQGFMMRTFESGILKPILCFTDELFKHKKTCTNKRLQKVTSQLTFTLIKKGVVINMDQGFYKEKAMFKLKIRSKG